MGGRNRSGVTCWETPVTHTTDVLIVGAGPVGLSAAAELLRHGADCRLVDRLPARLPYAKAVGIQPRTIELWDRMGLARAVVEQAVPLRGQLSYADGEETGRVELTLPPEVPYGFAALPQYEVERIIEEYLNGLGTAVERGTELLSFAQDADGVTARLRSASGAEEELRVRYLVGCDGAHSTVRKGLGLDFAGGAFTEEYLLGDVVADWDLPAGYAIRSEHRDADGATDGLLVCIPLPGPGRYRMSMRVPPEHPELSGLPSENADGADAVAHGLLGGRRLPELPDLQAVVDRLAPRPVTLSQLRWSSVFRISHRIVDRYGEGRVFVAGDAAHIHPPVGAQGMNTGIQDACNLAWKLALVVRGEAGPALLTSYDAERRPVGEEVVGRTVRRTLHGTAADADDPRTVLLREAELLVGYRDGPLATAPYGSADVPQPGDRAPDCAGLTTPVAAYPLRLLDILRDRPDHVVLLYAADPTDVIKAVLAPGWDVLAIRTEDGTHVPLVPEYLDTAGEFARLYRPDGPTGFVVRPDGHLGARFPLTDTETALADYREALG
ncbi:FAD-dependent monooxygenase [Streptomyces sp. NPDC090493]|uniref:FAD-dependent monooxygenase n=1 Tax=Streptomyces sp. NPDC090493 TaxID=3365964 RepID=UPI0037F8CB0E